MELSDPRVIGQLMEAATTRAQKRQPRMVKAKEADKVAYTGPAAKRRGCRCGACNTCKENARWEQIFAAKFADPTYYSGPVIRHGSPFNTF
jgi:hypothetical protein